MDVTKHVTRFLRAMKEFVLPSGQCLNCGGGIRDSEELFCSGQCSWQYWAQYRMKEGTCKGPVFVDCA